MVTFFPPFFGFVLFFSHFGFWNILKGQVLIFLGFGFILKNVRYEWDADLITNDIFLL